MSRRSTPSPVALITLPEGATFLIPGTGRTGLVLRTPSTSSAYCRIWLSPAELKRAAEQAETEKKKGKPKIYRDETISSSTLVVPTTSTSPSSTPHVAPVQ